MDLPVAMVGRIIAHGRWPNGFSLPVLYSANVRCKNEGSGPSLVQNAESAAAFFPGPLVGGSGSDHLLWDYPRRCSPKALGLVAETAELASQSSSLPIMRSHFGPAASFLVGQALSIFAHALIDCA